VCGRDPARVGRPRARGASGPAHQVRININSGDVIVEEHDTFGDGVNVAVRLEALAEPGGICVSRVVLDQVLARPVRAFALRPEAIAEPQALSVQAIPPMSQPALAPRLSIVVLSFANLSNDPEQGYFAEGTIEDLIKKGLASSHHSHPPQS
jgi:adenylate cyclase